MLTLEAKGSAWNPMGLFRRILNQGLPYRGDRREANLSFLRKPQCASDEESRHLHVANDTTDAVCVILTSEA